MALKAIIKVKKYIYFTILILFFSECKKNIQEPKSDTQKPQLSVAFNLPKTKELNKFSLKKVANWKEYNTLNTFVTRFDNISANEILINANEFKDLTKELKNNKKPEFLDTPSLNSRINVLENESLRLADMTLISSISAEEVEVQILKIIDILSSLNEKINTMYSQKQFEDTVTVNGDFFNVDTTSITKKEAVKTQPKKRPARQISNKKLTDLPPTQKAPNLKTLKETLNKKKE